MNIIALKFWRKYPKDIMNNYQIISDKNSKCSTYRRNAERERVSTQPTPSVIDSVELDAIAHLRGWLEH